MDHNAQAIAKAIIGAAQDGGYLDGNLANIPDLAESEKELFIDMLNAMRDYCQRAQRSDLTIDEISSMFAFVLAKAAEMVTNFVNNKPEKIATDGLFDGKIPFYADDVLIGFCKKSLWPIEAGQAFMDCKENLLLDAPELALFEALKWSFRISQHIVIQHLEKRHKL